MIEDGGKKLVQEDGVAEIDRFASFSKFQKLSFPAEALLQQPKVENLEDDSRSTAQLTEVLFCLSLQCFQPSV